ncbi:hypothetical protein [Acetobacterium bakii]|uniref:Uncharacterized protein n=1 Tax=Acetobacterium bakii TaxID=52689 RepID=A0A0L6TV57_9FIRM|nr:hypothetical protein [Acetobacterium bakii]KNZ40148.1 hypothetical protein AKG39_19195 [Acetobacterium bakii]
MSDPDEIWSDCSYRYEFCQLIDDLIKDIKHLESETVRTRYELSRHLECPYNEYLRSDILSDLARRYSDNSAYQIYIQLLYNNQDPMESDEWCEHIYRLAHGHDDSEY